MFKQKRGEVFEIKDFYSPAHEALYQAYDHDYQRGLMTRKELAWQRKRIKDMEIRQMEHDAMRETV